MTKPRRPRTLIALARTGVDVLILSAAHGAAFLFRFDGEPPFHMVKRMVFTWPYVVGLELAVLYAFSVPFFAWSYVGLREVRRVLYAVAVATLVLLAVRFLSEGLIPHFGYAVYALVPIGVIAINSPLAFLGVAGVRALRRLMTERLRSRNLRSPGEGVRTLLLGAGQAGVLTAKEIASRPDLAIRAVGFLDDNPEKLGTIVHGVRVLGTTSQVAEVTRRTGAKQALITIANANGAEIRRIARACEAAGIPAKIVPGIYEILDGRVNLTRLRDVSIEDLLRRDTVTLDQQLVRKFVRGKCIAVTGAGGSIGSELCRQVARFEPAQLVLMERSEHQLFTIHQELSSAFPELSILPVVADVCDATRVGSVFEKERPRVVFHAAAHKHVPMMEWNPGEAVKNNLCGTAVVADAADAHDIETFVLISTDKAVNPTSIMGATKRAAEMYIQALSQRSKTKYVAVRFGNVLASAGSVVPIFKAQIAAGGPVKITHPEMKRHFMTIPEASQLVMQAAAMGNGGEIYLLDMGEPILIADLARELIRLSGLEPEVDIELVYTGVRPGEKLFEELSFDAERMAKTSHQSIYVGKLRPCDLDEVRAKLKFIERVTDSRSRDEVRAALKVLVTELAESVDERRGIQSSFPPSQEVSLAPERIPRTAIAQ